MKLRLRLRPYTNALGIALESPQRRRSEDLQGKARPDFRRETPKF
jgi:hypothetical protein